MKTDGGERKQQVSRTLIYVFCIAACKELCFWLFRDQDLLNTVLKLIAGISMILVCRRTDYRLSSTEEKIIVIAVLLFIAGDMLIKWQFLISGALFLSGHLLLIICFWRKKKPTRKEIIVWVILTVVEAPFMMWLLRQYDFPFLIGCAAAAYGSILVLMAICALRQEKTLAPAAILFACSDLCLALSTARRPFDGFMPPVF